MAIDRLEDSIVTDLVQRYLDQILAEHAGVTGGSLADDIPELASADPDCIGLSASSSALGTDVRQPR